MNRLVGGVLLGLAAAAFADGNISVRYDGEDGLPLSGKPLEAYTNALAESTRSCQMDMPAATAAEALNACVSGKMKQRGDLPKVSRVTVTMRRNQ